MKRAISSSDEATESLGGGSAPERSGDSARVRAGFAASGRYQLGGLLGVGSMGLAFEARHAVLGYEVAIKVLRPELLEQPAFVQRFIQETHCLAALSSDHVVQLLDAGALETGLPFLVMEHLRGMSVSGLIKACRRLSTSVAVDYALQVCAGLADVHAGGLVHLDIKPSNLFVALRGPLRSQITILDFGVARRLDGSLVDVGLSDEGTLIGSPLYSSPEQIDEPEAVDARSDIWSLGVVMFEMLTGRTPFVGRTAPEVYARVLADAPVPLRRLRPAMDRRLAAIVESCLEKNREDRCESIQLLTAALTPFGSKALSRGTVPQWLRFRSTYRLNGSAARSALRGRLGPRCASSVTHR